MAATGKGSNVITPNLIKRSDFSPDFVFGVATSAYQIEGAAADHGKGPSIWDTFTLKNPDKIHLGANGNEATDSYHRTKEDVQLMKKMGFKAYRFSVAWSRILPGGKLSMGVNKEGVNYYNDLIDELLANGIEPYITLFHWDLPHALEQEYMGFLSARIVEDFVNFAELCFWEFGDRVKNWITFNEPWTFCNGGYVMGSFAPGRGAPATEHVEGAQPLSRCNLGAAHHCSSGNPGTEPYIVAHNLLLAHAAAVDLYRQKFQCEKLSQGSQQGKIGITLVTQWLEPLDPNSKDDQDCAERGIDFTLGWFLEPLTSGDYPNVMRKIVGSRLPQFSGEQSNLVRGSFDFLGLNYYTGMYVTRDIRPLVVEKPSYATDPGLQFTFERDGVPIGEQAGSEWLHIYPQGFLKLLLHVKQKWNPAVIYITENGVDEVNDHTKTLEEARVDPMRIRYYHDHLLTLKQAIDQGVNVQGYFAWSLLDNFEWGEGYNVRFGIIFVDFKNGLARYPKTSAVWFRDFLTNKNDTKASAKRIAEVEQVQTVKRTRK